MELFDLIDQRRLTAAARALPEPPTTQLNLVLPDVTVADIDYEVEQVKDSNKAASFRSFDAPVELGDAPELTSIRGEIPPLGEGYLVGEYRRLLEQQLRGANINDALFAAVVNKAARGFKAIRNRMELARAQVLTTGKFTLAGEGRLNLEADFGVPAANFVTPAAAWTASTDVVSELSNWAALAEIPIDSMLVGRNALPKIIRSEALRGVYAGSNAPTQLTLDQANQALSAAGLPSIIPVRRSTIQVADPVTGAYTAVEAFNPAKIVMYPTGYIGETKWGTTFEALELVSTGAIVAQEAPGLVATVVREGNPGKVFTKVDAVGIPVLAEPASLVVATV